MKSKGSLLTFIYYAHSLLFVSLLPGLSSFAVATPQSPPSSHLKHMAAPELTHRRVRRAVDTTGSYPSNLGTRQSGNSSASLEAMRVLRIKNIILGVETGDKNISAWYVAMVEMRLMRN